MPLYSPFHAHLLVGNKHGFERGSTLNKLYQLRKWLTLQEAAQQLATLVGEAVCEADVLRLGLDGHLKLSVNFVNHAKARHGRIIPIEEAQYEEFPSEFRPKHSVTEENKGKPIRVMQGIKLDDKRVLNLDNDVVTLNDVYDLAMLGSELLDIEHKYQILTNGPEITLQGLDGAFVTNEANTMYQLLESFDDNEYQAGTNGRLRELELEIITNNIKPAKAKALLAKHGEDRQIFLAKAKERRDSGRASENYFPAGGLPEDCVIVIRTEALREFEQSVNGKPVPTEKPLTTTERNTLLTIIAALCDYSDIEPKARGAAQQIANLTEELGAPVTDDTIHKALRQIPNAVERRMK